MYLGIDVAAKRVHCVAIADDGDVKAAEVIDADGIRAYVNDFASAKAVAIDAPSGRSARPHLHDDDPTLSAKFRSARCAELHLGREHRIWVPWVTPHEDPTGWIATGFCVFEAFRSAHVEAVEVYPYAAFRTLSGVRLPPKRSAAGIRARVAALGRRGISGVSLQMWSHDGLDALVAAVVARDHAHNRATKVTCGHDDSAIWLPAARSAA